MDMIFEPQRARRGAEAGRITMVEEYLWCPKCDEEFDPELVNAERRCQYCGTRLFTDEARDEIPLRPPEEYFCGEVCLTEHSCCVRCSDLWKDFKYWCQPCKRAVLEAEANGVFCVNR